MLYKDIKSYRFVVKVHYFSITSDIYTHTHTFRNVFVVSCFIVHQKCIRVQCAFEYTRCEVQCDLDSSKRCYRYRTPFVSSTQSTLLVLSLSPSFIFMYTRHIHACMGIFPRVGGTTWVYSRGPAQILLRAGINLLPAFRRSRSQTFRALTEGKRRCTKRAWRLGRNDAGEVKRTERVDPVDARSEIYPTIGITRYNVVP